MKIVDYETFIRMPAGTVFAPYEPCVFQDRFMIKVDAGWEYTDGRGEKRWAFNGTMPLEPWFEGDMSDWAFDLGTYDTELVVYDGDSNDAAQYKMFAVLERYEIDGLIFALEWAQNGCPGELEDYIKENKIPSQ